MTRLALGLAAVALVAIGVSMMPPRHGTLAFAWGARHLTVTTPSLVLLTLVAAIAAVLAPRLLRVVFPRSQRSPR